MMPFGFPVVPDEYRIASPWVRPGGGVLGAPAKNSDSVTNPYAAGGAALPPTTIRIPMSSGRAGNRSTKSAWEIRAAASEWARIDANSTVDRSVLRVR